MNIDLLEDTPSAGIGPWLKHSYEAMTGIHGPQRSKGFLDRPWMMGKIIDYRNSGHLPPDFLPPLNSGTRAQSLKSCILFHSKMTAQRESTQSIQGIVSAGKLYPCLATDLSMMHSSEPCASGINRKISQLPLASLTFTVCHHLAPGLSTNLHNRRPVRTGHKDPF